MTLFSEVAQISEEEATALLEEMKAKRAQTHKVSAAVVLKRAKLSGTKDEAGTYTDTSGRKVLVRVHRSGGAFYKANSVQLHEAANTEDSPTEAEEVETDAAIGEAVAVKLVDETGAELPEEQ